MKRNELTKTFRFWIMKNSYGLHDLYKSIAALQGINTLVWSYFPWVYKHTRDYNIPLKWIIELPIEVNDIAWGLEQPI